MHWNPYTGQHLCHDTQGPLSQPLAPSVQVMPISLGVFAHRYSVPPVPLTVMSDMVMSQVPSAGQSMLMASSEVVVPLKPLMVMPLRVAALGYSEQ